MHGCVADEVDGPGETDDLGEYVDEDALPHGGHGVPVVLRVRHNVLVDPAVPALLRLHVPVPEDE